MFQQQARLDDMSFILQYFTEAETLMSFYSIPLQQNIEK